jgi:hypothetical protein
MLSYLELVLLILRRQTDSDGMNVFVGTDEDSYELRSGIVSSGHLRGMRTGFEKCLIGLRQVT